MRLAAGTNNVTNSGMAAPIAKLAAEARAAWPCSPLKNISYFPPGFEHIAKKQHQRHRIIIRQAQRGITQSVREVRNETKETIHHLILAEILNRLLGVTDAFLRLTANLF